MVTPKAAEGRTARNVAVLSLGHAAVMALGGVLALLIAHFFGRSARTDAFFAAYGLYSVALVFSQAFRLTALPRLVEDRDDEVSNRLLAGVGVVIVLAAVPMVLLAGPFGELLADEDPTGVATESLRALWPALGGQLLIGLLAALLLVRGAFGVIGLGYVASGLISIAVFVALEGELGIQAVSVALGASSISLAVVFFVVLARQGWRFRPQAYARIGEATAEAGRLMVASASFAGGEHRVRDLRRGRVARRGRRGHAVRVRVFRGGTARRHDGGLGSDGASSSDPRRGRGGGRGGVAARSRPTASRWS